MKKLKGIIIVFMVSLASILMPFNDIHADTLSSANITGSQVVLLEKTQNVAVTNNWYYLYETTLYFDNNYIGWVNLDINLTYYAPSGYEGGSYIVSSLSNKRFYINGNTIKINQIVGSDNYNGIGPYVSNTYVHKSSNVTKYTDISSLQQIIDILGDIYQDTSDIEGLSTNQLTELQNIVTKLTSANVTLTDIDGQLINANEFLEYLTKVKTWNIPIESLSWNYYMIQQGYEYNNYEPFKVNYFTYPIFSIAPNDVLFQFYTSASNLKEYTVVFLTNRNVYSLATLQQYFSVTDGEFSNITRLNTFRSGNNNYNLIKFTISNFTVATNVIVEFSYIGTQTNTKIIPIYFNPFVSYAYTSTDFALQFGLSNKLLDNLNIIANGTIESNQAATNLDQSTNQMQNQINNFTSIEDSYNQQFNNSLDTIDFSNPIQNNAGLLPAAQFVISVFNGLINNQLSVLIIIVCILIVGKKVIGK